MIALIGSRDPLTARLAQALAAAGRPFVTCALGERTRLDGGAGEDVQFRVENLGALLRRLGELGVTEVCFSGAVRRPTIDPGAVDEDTAPMVPRLLAALREGDDGALRAVLGLFKEAGFGVASAPALAPDLLPPPGVLSRRGPTPAQEADAAKAERVHRILAPADVGQGLVLRDGQVLAVEAAPGTDWMLRSLAGLGGGALFFKAPKAGQDRRVDLPVIGPATVERAAASGLAAVAVEAGGVMVLDREACAAAADAAGLVLWVREPGP